MTRKPLAAYVFACVLAIVLAPSTCVAEELVVIAWNVESGGADPATIGQRIADFQGVDLWGFSEVENAAWLTTFENAAEIGEDAQFRSILGATCKGDQLGMVWDTSELKLIKSEELHDINVGGGVRAPLVGRFRYLPTGDEFLFCVNHLYRSKQDQRHQQARLLNTWAAKQKLPVICVGDFNFDWSVASKGQQRDAGFDLLTAHGVFEWVRPDTIVKTNDSRHNSVLDFIFITKGGPWTSQQSTIVVARGDFPDDNKTPDHRPVKGTFTFEAEQKPAEPKKTKPKKPVQSTEEILELMSKAYAECTSYFDSGALTITTPKEGGGTHTTIHTFTTAFMRSGTFRFEFTTTRNGAQSGRRIIWSDGTRIQEWRSASGKGRTRKQSSLDRALGSARTASDGLLEMIPPLLLPDDLKDGARRLTNLPDPERISNALHEQLECIRIRNTLSDGAIRTVWIDTRTHLVVRIDFTSAPNEPKSEHTTLFTPVINGDIPPMLLEFNAPE